jgi:hypothetical protein
MSKISESSGNYIYMPTRLPEAAKKSSGNVLTSLIWGCVEKSFQLITAIFNCIFCRSQGSSLRQRNVRLSQRVRNGKVSSSTYSRGRGTRKSYQKKFSKKSAEIIQSVKKGNYDAFIKANWKYKEDFNTVLAVVSIDPRLLEHACYTCRCDSRIFEAIVNSDSPHRTAGLYYSFADVKRMNHEVMLKALTGMDSANTRYWLLLSRLYDDIIFIRDLSKVNDYAFEHASYAVHQVLAQERVAQKRDQFIARLRLSGDISEFKNAPAEFRDDFECVRVATVEIDPRCLQYASYTMRRYRPLILEIAQSKKEDRTAVLLHTFGEFAADREIVKEALRGCKIQLKYHVDEVLRDDEAFIRELIVVYPLAYEMASLRVQRILRPENFKSHNSQPHQAKSARDPREVRLDEETLQSAIRNFKLSTDGLTACLNQYKGAFERQEGRVKDLYVYATAIVGNPTLETTFQFGKDDTINLESYKNQYKKVSLICHPNRFALNADVVVVANATMICVNAAKAWLKVKYKFAE